MKLSNLNKLSQYIKLTAVVLLFACSQEATTTTNVTTNTNTTNQEQKQPATQLSSTKVQTAQKSGGLYIEGKHYIRIGEPVRNANGKIEVAEAFWYGCPHCFSTEPYLESWEKTKPANVEMLKIAAPLSGIWGFHAQVYYTNKSLGIAKKLHKATFNAIHQQGKRLSSLDEVSDFYQQQAGIDPEKYKKAFNSFGVSVQLKKASSLLEQYQINSVPTFVVGGAYQVSAKSAGSIPGIFNVIDYLVSNKF